ncbi:MAG TPA: hypothetical protein VNC61_05750 [Acidimicrobiales bacterium]|nr:hypothetical protein [Acidimicrobiales bacterium]
MSAASETPAGEVGRYIELGLAIGRHIDGFVDAYYGPPGPAVRAAAGAPPPPDQLVSEARALIASLDAGADLDDQTAPPESDLVAGARRRWLRAQVVGLLTTARRLAGEPVGYVEEVESCYGVRPAPVPEEQIAAAHRRLSKALPGTGAIADRLIAWREAHVVSPDRLPRAIDSLAEDLRERTDRLFGLPDGEHIDFELVHDKPWSGFNTYLGDLHSRVAINTDLPVLSTSLAHLVAHEAYPGHHTEHSRKELGLVRRRRWLEESIFLVGTPQCLIAEGLADLGLETVLGPRPENVVAGHLHPLGIRYDADVIAAVSEAGEALGAVRGNAAWRLYVDGADPQVVVDEVARWSLLPRVRAEKAVQFLLHPTWRAYISCYVEGLPLCRRFVAGDPARFGRLLTEQMLPADLDAA